MRTRSAHSHIFYACTIVVVPCPYWLTYVLLSAADDATAVTHIFGISCIYPGAAATESVPGFWSTASKAADLPVVVPYNRWDIERHYSPEVTGELDLPRCPNLILYANQTILTNMPCCMISLLCCDQKLQWKRCTSGLPVSSPMLSCLTLRCSGMLQHCYTLAEVLSSNFCYSGTISG